MLEGATAREWEAQWADRGRDIRRDVFRERSRLTVSEFAERRRYLTKGQMAGQLYTNEEAPYLVEIMNVLSDPFRPRKAVVMKSARVGYTEGVIGNLIAYCIDQDPTDVIVMHPTDEEAAAYSVEHLEPMFKETPCLRERLSLDTYKDSRNTIAYKKYAGGSLAVIGPKGSALRRRSARVAASDEIDELDDSYEQGDPLARLDKRLDDFDDGIHIRGSTPTNKGNSRIENEYAGSDQRRYFVNCPHCGTSQPLEWGGKDTAHGIKWGKEVHCRSCGCESEYGAECSECGSEQLEVRHAPETAHYVCVKGCIIDEAEKRAMIQPENGAAWIATNPMGKYPGWHIHALMSLFPGARWPKIVDEWIDAQGDPEKLKVFINTVLGEPWEDPDQKRAKVEGLAARAEHYGEVDGVPIEVPHGVGVLVAGVDVQGDRVELLVQGFGAGREQWDIFHERIWGDPTKAATWGKLDHLLARAYRHAGGAELRIAAAMIDSGFKTDEVYAFVRPRDGRNVWASKGDSGAEGAIPLSRPTRANADGVKFWTIGTFTLKDALFSRLAVEKPGPKYVHLRQHTPELCNGFDAEYFAQFGREKKVPKRIKGTLRWKKQYVETGANEAVDLHVMCDAALRALGPAIYENLAELARIASQPPEPEPKEEVRADADIDWASGGGRWGSSW